MTSKNFHRFCIYFAAKISHYRLQLHPDLASETTILIVDNHPSRLSSFAIEFLRQNNIHLLTMPPHTSHILQPFDVTVAKSLKSLMNKTKLDKEVNSFSEKFGSKAAQARYIISSSIINSWNSIKIETLQNGFIYTGIYPLNPQIAISNKRVKQTNDEIPEKYKKLLNFSNQLLTSDENRLKIYEKNYKIHYINVSQIPKIHPSSFDYLKRKEIAKGNVLSNFPSLMSPIRFTRNTFLKCTI